MAWKPIYSTSKRGNRYLKSWTDGEVVISNRKYQERYGNVAKHGFSTIEQKNEATIGYHIDFAKSKTRHYNYELGYTPSRDVLKKRIKYVLSIENTKATKMMLFMITPNQKKFSTQVWRKGEIDAMIEDLEQLFRKYEKENEDEEISKPRIVLILIENR